MMLFQLVAEGGFEIEMADRPKGSPIKEEGFKLFQQGRLQIGNQDVSALAQAEPGLYSLAGLLTIRMRDLR